MNFCLNFFPDYWHFSMENTIGKCRFSLLKNHIDSDTDADTRTTDFDFVQSLFSPQVIELFLNIFKWMVIVAALTLMLVYPLFAEDGMDWLKKIEAAENVPHSYGTLTQTITTSAGKERSFAIRSWSREDGDESLMLYESPPRVKGDKILQLEGGDHIWYYMKRQDVERHFAGHQRKKSAMGSDFSYEDLASGNITEDYTAEFQGFEDLDGEKCVKLKCTPTESGPSYEYIILWASVNDHFSRKIEYYDEKGHLKTLYISDFRTIEDRKTAFVMDMVNHREGSHTLMVTNSITFKDEPEAWMFQKDALSREIQ